MHILQQRVLCLESISIMCVPFINVKVIHVRILSDLSCLGLGSCRVTTFIRIYILRISSIKLIHYIFRVLYRNQYRRYGAAGFFSVYVSPNITEISELLPPASIVDLEVKEATLNNFILTFTSSGEDYMRGQGQQDFYIQTLRVLFFLFYQHIIWSYHLNLSQVED